MYALFAFIAGRWGIAGIDEHEECAVMFIDTVDETFGDGTAFVCKLPDKSGYTPIADEAAKHLHDTEMQDMLDTLKSLEDKSLDLDEALKNFNK